MLDFVARNWIWIVLIGAMVAMHVRHGTGGHGSGGGGTGGGGGGCGAGHGGHQDNHRDQHSHDRRGRQHPEHHGAGGDRGLATNAGGRSGEFEAGDQPSSPMTSAGPISGALPSPALKSALSAEIHNATEVR